MGSYVGLSKLLVLAFPVFLLAWLRFGIAAVAMAPWLRRPENEPTLSGHDKRLLFLESFIGNFLFSICMLFGVALTSALSAGVVMAAIPAAVALLSRIFLHERLSPRVVVAVLLAAAGIVLLSLARMPATGSMVADTQLAWQTLLGHGLLLAAVLCEACYVVIGKKLTAQLGPKRISSLINLWGLVLVTPFGLAQAWGFDFGAVALLTWGLLVFYSIAASMVTVWLWMQGLRTVPAGRAGIFMVMLPIGSAGVGLLLLGETFTLTHTLAFALALAGLLLATWPQSAAATLTHRS